MPCGNRTRAVRPQQGCVQNRATRETKLVNPKTARPLRTRMRACTHAHAHTRIQSHSAAYAHAGVSARAAHWQARDLARIKNTDDAYIHQRVRTHGRIHTDTPRACPHGHVHAHACKLKCTMGMHGQFCLGVLRLPVSISHRSNEDACWETDETILGAMQHPVSRTVDGQNIAPL